MKRRKNSRKRGGQAQNRTGDTRIFSPVKRAKKPRKTKENMLCSPCARAALALRLAVAELQDESKMRILVDDLKALVRELEAA